MTEYDLGPQPLESVMQRFELTSVMLVESSTQQLSFKMVQKGRKGRRLTPNVRKKILAAVRACIPDAEVGSKITLKDLFNYD